LLHDVHPYAANALDELVDDVRGRGLRFTTPREWIGEGGP
jgi:peptidoglycan/xylan/chitin deacetylase (PgdA/CDA1 family)